MTTDAPRRLDTADLEARVKAMYERVALTPDLGFHFQTGRALAEHLGYPAPDLDTVPAEAVESFAGVGYFLDLADIRPGEEVLDLGSGSGTDSFLAAAATGPAGRVIGVDMTAAQLAKASRPAGDAGMTNAEFREGYIERPPVEDGSVDCVIQAAAAALRPGGRLVLADTVTATQLPDGVTCDASLWAACIGGAARRDHYLRTIRAAGFEIDTVRRNDYRFVSDRVLGATTSCGVTSISLLAHLA